VVNLDFDAGLQARTEGLSVLFPALMWIRKLSLLHAEVPHVDWSLCLTFNAEIAWPNEVEAEVQDFLKSNFDQEPTFAAEAREFVGDEFFDRLTSSQGVAFSRLSQEQSQQLLMLFVPKKIAELVAVDGWLVNTRRNLRYGGATGAAMVSWIFDMKLISRGRGTAAQLYGRSLKTILPGAARIDENGRLL
jgi:hypothetical protein